MMARPSYCSWRRSCEGGRREGEGRREGGRRREGRKKKMRKGRKEGEVEQRDKESINIQSKTETHL